MISTSDKQQIMVWLPAELAAQLDAKARAEDRSKSSFVRRAIQAALADARGGNSTSYNEESER